VGLSACHVADDNIVIGGRAERVMNTPLRLACALVLLVQLAAGCEKTAKKDAADAPARRQLLENLGERVFLPTFERFVARARALEASTKVYAASLSDGDRKAARASWNAAMAAWQRAELMQVGPSAIAADSVAGGKGLRNEIYSWPDVFACGLDRVLVTKQYNDLATLREATYFNARGLAALESLLYDERITTDCKSDDSTVTPAAWAELVAGDLAQRRADYAQTLALDVRTNAEALVSAWKVKGGFLDELRSAGDGSKLFPSTHDAISAVSDVLFYLDTETKDMKVGVPAGQNMTCMETPCPERVEHPHARVSKSSLIANVEAFAEVFRGLPPSEGRGDQMWGMRDLLIAESAQPLADEMDRLIDDAVAKTTMIPGSFEDAVAAKHPSVVATYKALSELTGLLKSQYIMVLDVRVPMHAAGDND
jgi:predicted lipoprotein